MKKKQIYIFTTLHEKPMHNRLETNLNLLKESFDVKIYSTSYENNQRVKINYLSLNFFLINRIFEFKKHLKFADIVYIQTLYLLPLAIFAKLKRKKVIYETLDNDVHLKFYGLTLQRPFIKKIKWIIIPFMSVFEKFLSTLFTDKIITNSKALQKYFNNKSELLLYTSPLEKIVVKNNYKNTPALLYVGYVSKEKGLKEMLTLSNGLNLKLFIMGKLKDPIFLEDFKKNKNIIYFGQLSSEDMIKELKKLLAEYFLFGISIIHPIHYSYATQEANKDIDFLSLGIPIIGNERSPTAEKINAGCGIDYRIEKIEEIVRDEHQKQAMSENSLNYYKQYYNSNLYKNKFEKIINSFIN